MNPYNIFLVQALFRIKSKNSFHRFTRKFIFKYVPLIQFKNKIQKKNLMSNNKKPL